MKRTMTCIACPRGCLLNISETDGNITVTENQCSRGVDYALQELKESLRMLTTTVRTSGTDYPRLAVRLSRDVPLRLFPDYMKVISRIIHKGSCIPGDILAENLLDSGIDLISTGAVNSEVAKSNDVDSEKKV
ncbi:MULTISPECIES: DUF1667 domain-containing protein [unclassified Oceanispirochaeta]|uniref:DUF1667 domain-containing protein n=1 Tax=unclassified Oceanispirochaeta TaxID=2635722 RepID=UPI000E0913B2|nr:MULTISPECIES: DUF1667 domain-containing protein [unclassified Oceanispirochaeta]MBF9015100.1 DUF1667 domain-containing protein [Oceanispirochaeta sp. M2]NPD71558.1 DUF1667 domain-containing protein [Oceanispirochaeta sp. M1]RDG33127.1 DUF1667 domain-containing protein [Oceanispirochaeta sp. M1]